jgi:hypothetical protein
MMAKHKSAAVKKPAASTPKAKQQVPAVKQQSTAVAKSEFDEFKQDRSVGLENVTAKDVVIPRLVIIQKMSPQVDAAVAEYNAEAEVGNFFNTSTQDLFEDEIEVIPCHYETNYLEWHPRQTGKGLARNHGTDGSILAETQLDDRRRNILPNGNYVQETATYYVLLNVAGNWQRAFIPLTSTQLKHHRKWMTMITGIKIKNPDTGEEVQAPIYYKSWKCSNVDESNADGSWKSWKFAPGRLIKDIDPSGRLLAEARRYHNDASSAKVRGDLSQDDTTISERAVTNEKAAF